ncbi:uncharacterized protein Z520_08531 [Fonsecaea multimorphosa CBS 102226]|uniref:Uncharacterized protein n=1 Tax=Fonsecaea multimorphosa CBS 102226 TaxID=1442371 RepID=A0A0D2KGN1_9EURO|nr:uncharacterized protein Z520_08531 [Fonsecaea multimorphosa CBS 102226]KIX95823.1 hypothetical protein Z520_08531 [Fonsecaea multimorphosa CBS 102226]OAL21558.1 hypothetical protein AYO22_07954 [Fonsecaea multimorphosa]
MSRRESVGRLRAGSQSDSAPPSVKMVSCAVLPPHLPAGMAPPTGIGASEAISYDEALNWEHNNSVHDEEPSRRKSLFRKVGLTTQRKRRDSQDDLPPFVMRQIPYDTWRKHYAKDKDGNYRGTHAPAEDCLLKPEDVQKWRLGDPVTKADKWTRGREALPVYSEVRAEGAVPDYQADYDHPDQTLANKGTMTREGDSLAEYFDASDLHESGQQQTTSTSPQSFEHPIATASSQPISPYQGQTIADGRTAAEIIEEARTKGKLKSTWRQKLSKGISMTMAAP